MPNSDRFLFHLRLLKGPGRAGIHWGVRAGQPVGDMKVGKEGWAV
jgi:hypothetical protein